MMKVNEFDSFLELYEYKVNGDRFKYKFSAGFRATLSFGGVNFSAEFINFDGFVVPGSIISVVVRTNFKVFDDGYCFGGRSIRLLDGTNVIGVLTSVGDVREIDVS